MSKPNIEIVDKGKDFKVYYMWQDISDLSLYDRTKAIERFVNNATKTLETLISSDLREFLGRYGIIPQDGSEQALERAFLELEHKGKQLGIIDRYYKLNDEHIISESPNKMTVIYENKEKTIIGCMIEVRIENVYD